VGLVTSPSGLLGFLGVDGLDGDHVEPLALVFVAHHVGFRDSGCFEAVTPVLQTRHNGRLEFLGQPLLGFLVLRRLGFCFAFLAFRCRAIAQGQRGLETNLLVGELGPQGVIDFRHLEDFGHPVFGEAQPLEEEGGLPPVHLRLPEFRTEAIILLAHAAQGGIGIGSRRLEGRSLKNDCRELGPQFDAEPELLGGQ